MLNSTDVLLVTGGLGFIGCHLIKYLLEDNPHGWHVYNLDALSFGSSLSNTENFDTDLSKYILFVGDINNIATINFPHKPTVILNLAAETHVDRSIYDPGRFVNSNYLGVYKLLEYARKNDVSKFVQVSTDEVYGESSEGISFDEDDVLAPGNPYSATKAAADLISNSYCKTYGLNISITRCANNFGPRQSAEKLIPATIMRILKGLPILLYGDGQQVRDWLYVYDHVTAISKVMENGKSNEIYNISASNLVSNCEIVQKINNITRECTGKSSTIENVEDRPGHDQRYSLNSEKIKIELNWKPVFGFDQALVKTIKWYIENEKWLCNSYDQHKVDEYKTQNSNFP